MARKNDKSNLLTLYAAEATATGGRMNGTVKTSDNAIDLRLILPKELGGSEMEKGTNPEQLFACAWAASFADSVGFVAKQHNLNLSQVCVTAKVKLSQLESNGFNISAEFAVDLPELTKAKAKEITAEARINCPYMKAFQKIEAVKISFL